MFAFVSREAFLPSYLPIVERRRSLEYEIANGTSCIGEDGMLNSTWFMTGVRWTANQRRTESILSLPPLVRWEYGYKPDNTPEAELYETFLKPQDWASWTP